MKHVKHCEPLVKHHEPLVKQHETLLKHCETSWNTQHSPFNTMISVLDAETSALCAATSALVRSFWQNRHGVSGNWGVGITHQMWNKVTDRGDKGTFSKPRLSTTTEQSIKHLHWTISLALIKLPQKEFPQCPRCITIVSLLNDWFRTEPLIKLPQSPL